MALRSKFKVVKVFRYADGNIKIDLAPVESGEGFFKVAPWGLITIGAVGEDVAEELQLDSEIYVDFTKA